MLFDDWLDIKDKYREDIEDLIDYHENNYSTRKIGTENNMSKKDKNYDDIFYDYVKECIERKSVYEIKESDHAIRNIKQYVNTLFKDKSKVEIERVYYYKGKGKGKARKKIELLSRRLVFFEDKDSIKVIKLFINRNKPRKLFFKTPAIRFVNRYKKWNTINKYFDAILFNPLRGEVYTLPLVPED